MYSLIIYLIIVYISFYLHNISKTEEIKKKYNKKILLIELIHHFISNYITYGGILFGYHKFHLIIIVILVILWFKYNNDCPITLYCNKKTNQSLNAKFKDLNYFIKEKINVPYYHILIIIIIYDLYFIFKKN